MVMRGALMRTAAAVLCLMLVSTVLVAFGGGRDGPAPAPAGGMAEDAGERSVDYRWYDFFEVPYGEWWFYRWFTYEADQPWTDSFPYINRYYHNLTHVETFSSARLNITARSFPEVNMGERPLFLPFLSGEDGERGGHATIDWYMQYLTADEIDYYPMSTAAWHDGWVISLNGTVRLDRTAAMAVMNLTDEAFDDFNPWWEENKYEVLHDYTDWVLYEGNERLDIFPMYSYPLTPLRFDIEAESVGDEIVLTYDTITWGMEALMTRWLRDAFMPTEWYFEDFTMHAEIGPEGADLDIDTVVPYAIKAWETKEDRALCWAWQGMLQDCIPSTVVHPISAYDVYYGKDHLSLSPGSFWYEWMVPYEYVPGSFNLSEGESLSFEWPEEEILFLEHEGPFMTTNHTAKAMVRYSEPMSSEMDGIEYLPTDRTLTFSGPMDLWTWSEDQDEHNYLADEWDRLGALPWGMPYVEMSMWETDTPPVAALEAQVAPDATAASQYVLNASQSCDSEDTLDELQFRWDLDGDGAMDTDWAYDPVIEHDFGASGTFEVSVAVMDTDNMTSATSAEVTVPELDPPATAVSLEGTDGLDGWFLSQVTVTLTAEDASGVAGTYYSMNEGAWIPYSGSWVVGSEGAWEMSYYSVDAMGNVEPPRETAVKVDLEDPQAHIEGVSFDEESRGNVTITWLCNDLASGVNRSEVSLDGGGWTSVGLNQSQSYSDLGEGEHTFEVVVYDNAGRSHALTEDFTVTSDDALLYIMAGVSIAAVAVAASVLLLYRRRAPRA